MNSSQLSQLLFELYNTETPEDERKKLLLTSIADCEINDYLVAANFLFNIVNFDFLDSSQKDKVMSSVIGKINSIQELTFDAGTNLAMLFAERNEIGISVKLIEAGISIESQNSGGDTILFYAVLSNKLENITKLESIGASFNLNEKQQANLIHTACANGNLEIIKYLLDKGISPTIKDSFNKNCLETISLYSDSPDVMNFMFSYFDQDKIDSSQLLHNCIINENNLCTTLLLEKGIASEFFDRDTSPGDIFEHAFQDFISDGKNQIQENDEELVKGKCALYIMKRDYELTDFLSLSKEPKHIKFLCNIYKSTPMQLLRLDLDDVTKRVIKLAFAY